MVYFGYNGLEERTHKWRTTLNTTTETQYTLDVAGGLPHVIVETSEGQTSRYLTGLAQQQDNVWAYQHPDGAPEDGRGSVRHLSDASAEVTLLQSYDPFGTLVEQSGPGASGFGYTGEQEVANNGLVFLRARYYDPSTGRFLTEDPKPGIAYLPQSLNIYTYAWNNPILRVDPSGLQPPPPECNDPGQICYTGTVGTQVLNTGPGIVGLQDPLSEQQWNIIKHEATRFGIPKELLAATIAAEITFDTDWVNTFVYDPGTGIVGALMDYAYASRDRPLFNMCSSILEGFHEYFGLAPYLEKRGIGYGFAPGIANIHAGPAVRVENYINTTYPDQNLLPSLGLQNQKAVRLRTLLSDEGNIRYAAGYLRQWADIRKGTTSSHITDLTDSDMIIIYTVYRCSVDACYEGIEGFQNAEMPSQWGSPDDFSVYLPLYKNKP